MLFYQYNARFSRYDVKYAGPVETVFGTVYDTEWPGFLQFLTDQGITTKPF